MAGGGLNSPLELGRRTRTGRRSERNSVPKEDSQRGTEFESLGPLSIMNIIPTRNYCKLPFEEPYDPRRARGAPAPNDGAVVAAVPFSSGTTCTGQSMYGVATISQGTLHCSQRHHAAVVYFKLLTRNNRSSSFRGCPFKQVIWGKAQNTSRCA